jgi:catechol 2,3-dioxygenase-like lactoylglutathione lyase family enzyme
MADRARVRSTTPLLIVKDLQRSVDFYCGKLGFGDPSMWGEPPCFAMMNRDGFDLMLSVAEKPEHVAPHGAHGVWDMYIAISDIASEIETLKANNVAIAKGPTDTFYNMREIEVRDPDGHLVCFAQDIGVEPLAFAELWQGTLDIGSAKLRLVLKLAPSQGSVVGRLDSPDQNATNLLIDRIHKDGASFRFEMHTIGATFDGKFNDANTELAGTWSQRGRLWPLAFRKQ